MIKKSSTSGLYFNTQEQKQELISFEYDGHTVSIDAQKLKELKQGPIAFVFNQHENVWAHSFMAAMKTAIVEWSPDGTAPEFDYMTVSESSGELADKINEHRFFDRSSGKRSTLVSVGNVASAQVARYRSGYSRLDIAQLFYVTGDPEKLELRTVIGTLLPNTNGVYAVDARSVAIQVRTLKSLSNRVKNVAIVLGNRHVSDLAYAEKTAAAQQLIVECAKHGIRASQLHLTEGMQIAIDLAPLADTYDALITLRDDIVYGLATQISDFCGKNQVVFFASDTVSVARGAAIGFGSEPEVAVALLTDLLMRQKHCHLPLHAFEMAITEEDVVMKKNLQSIRKQVRDLTQKKDDLLSMLDIRACY